MAPENSNDTAAPDRTRAHPAERFAPSSQVFDLDAAVAELSAEPTASQRGHRQKTLYRHGTSSLSLFVFERGAELREHRTSGTVFIQVLRGRMVIGAGGERHEVPAGRVLVMSPGVPHDLRAEEPTHMLLTIAIQSPAPDGNT